MSVSISHQNHFNDLDFRSAQHPDPVQLTQNMEKLSQILRGNVARPGVAV